MSIERVKDYFGKWGIADRVLEFDVSSATVISIRIIGCRCAKYSGS